MDPGELDVYKKPIHLRSEAPGEIMARIFIL